jgi:hypothetical protein
LLFGDLSQKNTFSYTYLWSSDTDKLRRMKRLDKVADEILDAIDFSRRNFLRSVRENGVTDGNNWLDHRSGG